MGGATTDKKGGPDPQQSESHALSLWIQWTVPSMTFSSIYQQESKLTLELEDFLSSFDWAPIYFQAKMRLLSANLRHFKASGKDGFWVPGDYKGVVMGCTDDIANQLHTVNVKNNNIEVLPHSRHVDAEQVWPLTQFFSFSVFVWRVNQSMRGFLS